MVYRSTTPPAFQIDVFSNDCHQVRPLGPYMSCAAQWKPNVATLLKFVVPWDHPLAARLQQNRIDIVPIRTFYNGIPWDGRVLKTNIKGKPGSEVITVTCISNYRWLGSMLGWPDGLLPIWVQFPPQDIMIGDIDFVAKYFVVRNATRLQSPVYVKIPNGLGAGVDSVVQGIQNELIANPFPANASVNSIMNWVGTMTEGFCALMSRMAYLDKLFANALDRAERELTINLHVPGLDSDPGAVFNTDSISALTNILDYAGSNFLMSVAEPWNSVPQDHACYIVDTKTRRDRRYIRWTTESGQIMEFDRSIDSPTAYSCIVGGKAPSWLNMIIGIIANLALQSLIDLISAGLGVIAPIAPDISKFVADIFFAFEQFTDTQMRLDLGIHAFPEVFGDSTAAYTLDGFSHGLTALNKASGGDAVKFTVMDGGFTGRSLPTYGVDNGVDQRYMVGDIMTFEDRGNTIEDYVSEVNVVDDRKDRCKVTVTIGSPQPVKTGMQKLADQFSEFSSLTDTIATSL